MAGKRHIVSGGVPHMRRGWYESAPPKVLVTDRRPRLSAEATSAVRPAGEAVSVPDASAGLTGEALAAYVRARRTAALSRRDTAMQRRRRLPALDSDDVANARRAMLRAARGLA